MEPDEILAGAETAHAPEAVKPQRAPEVSTQLDRTHAETRTLLDSDGNTVTVKENGRSVGGAWRKIL